MLIHEAIGDQLTCVFVDTGLMRQGEAEEVVRLFRDHYNIPLVHVDAEELFLSRSPASPTRGQAQDHRQTVHRRVRRGGEEGRRRRFLAQGTLYPDVIESVSFTGGPSVTIKSHHNVGGLPERMNMKLVEPLRELFKDEVRELGRELGLPEAFVGRHPFPGPGLAIRIPGEVTQGALRHPAQGRRGLSSTRSARPASTMRSGRPSRSAAGPHGRRHGRLRTYDSVCALRAVTSVDGMTAD